MHEALLAKSRPSRTAQRVALRRAAHQILDHPRVFEDPLAIAIAGGEAEGQTTVEQPHSRSLRAFIAVRSRYAEDQLAAAVARGVRQYVVLGAGLDTFAYRNPFQSAGLRVFEVDHPATQEWKRAQLGAAGIAIPAWMTFVAVDFERQSLEEGLRIARFEMQQPAIFAWLGVTPYLSRAAFDGTIHFIAGMPSGSCVVFDYAVERALLSPSQQQALDALAARVARAGEPFRLFFDPAELSRDLERLGYSNIEDLDCERINARYFSGRSDGLAVTGGGHLITAHVA
ncbi:MAG TPA: SAM-dependent methyltransferase [Bryobacteraceae bacterium]|jgi:methyltransferase (TIGR00027 family)|nr:SAM-dependent methyltransferase [Bryobacteraceae bacterium]